MHSVALVLDQALIVAVHKVGCDVGLFQRVQEPGAPKFRDKSSDSHKSHHPF